MGQDWLTVQLLGQQDNWQSDKLTYMYWLSGEKMDRQGDRQAEKAAQMIDWQASGLNNSTDWQTVSHMIA